ncbi:hypothetical protein B484DRAFT_198514 [Ochromonadaceae sp. CCMP2298]|nr:hypothetical protein B484DRAFT_198514 [Ochromonadaceae sp. CCMP2298]
MMAEAELDQAQGIGAERVSSWQALRKLLRYTVHPGSSLRCAWEVVVLWAVLYYGMAVPVRVMVRYQCGGSLGSRDFSWDYSLLVDYICDLLLLLDLLLRSAFFAYRRAEGGREVVEVDRAQIWATFRKSPRFPLLLWLALPTDLLSLWGGGGVPLLRTLKLPSLLLIAPSIDAVQRWVELERGGSISAEAVTVAQLAIATLLCTTWMSVIWAVLRQSSVIDANGGDGGGGGGEEGGPAAWVGAVYWVLTTMTTTGYGDITPQNSAETAYTIFVCIVGPTIFATIVGKVASYVKQ